MNKLIEKIINIKTQILEKQVNREKELLIKEMKKIGIEKLPYSYSALKQFVDPETMDFHYNKHYKGYVDKLNAALAKKKYGDLELEQIIKTISRFDKTIRNNAGGAFNHSLFWNMLTPKPKKLQGELYKKITKEFGSFPSFKKKFENIAKERFGSGWVWLVLTSKNTLKIMSTPNQDNPLMNVVEGGGFPLLGLDLWEHAYYLKYRNKRDEYISNFWKVVNWDFVTKLYEMKTETKLLESVELEKIISKSKTTEFCTSNEVRYYRELINNPKIKKVYQDGITNILKKVFNHFWVDDTTDEMSGFYGLESKEGRSILNNLNTNFNSFCLLTKTLNEQITDPKDKFDFSLKENRNISEINRLINELDIHKNKIFTKDNEGFINIIKVLIKLWNRGKKTENDVTTKLSEYFGDKSLIKQISRHGEKNDAIKGIDLIIELNGKKYTAQIKPFSNIKNQNGKITVFDTGNVKPYRVNWLIFINTKSKRILIFNNKPIKDHHQYVFDESSLLHEIE